MRLVHLMSFVCAMLLLATIPACLQFARLAGVQTSPAMVTLGVVALIALVAAKRV